MSSQSTKYEKMRRSRIRRVKRILRHMPRKATLHKYPFIKFFAKSARKRPYLWSFRVNEVIPALYSGFILTFLPLQGVQIPVAFCLALVFKANLMILVALQLISNPLTLIPLYYAAYQIGNYIFNLVGNYSHTQVAVADMYTAETGLTLGMQAIMGIRYIFATMVGGLVMGLVSGFIASIIYQQASKSYIKRHPEKNLILTARKFLDP